MSIESFFQPESVAVIGASRRKGKVGHEIVVSLLRDGFAGDIYPVNPRAEKVENLRCYPSVQAIGTTPDLAVIVVHAQNVPDVIRQCGQAGCEKVIVITSGFKEAGQQGAKLEQRVRQLAREYGMRLIGPNCLGIMSPANRLNASFGGPLPNKGGIGYFSQSGSLLAAVVDIARSFDIGFSKLISIGNMADVNELDVLRAFGNDNDTKVIAGYLETITDGDAFIREAERISRIKPILLVKAGQTGAGAKAAWSHTGRLANAQRAYEVVFERAGIIRCESITAQFDYARALLSRPPVAVGGTVIIANAGGPGIMAVDAAETHELELAKLPPEIIERLKAKLPSAANVSNPIDVMGDALADRFETSLQIALSDPSVHMALVLLTPHAMTECDKTAQAIVRIAALQTDKPIFACFLGAERVRKAIEILRTGGVPCFGSPEFAISSMKAVSDYAHWRNRPKRVVKLFPVNRRKVEKIISRCLRTNRRKIDEMEAMEVLEAYGFVTPKGTIAASAEQAADFAEEIGYPVVLKIWSPDIANKAEVGGVRSGLTSRSDVRDAFDLMMYRIPKKCPGAVIAGVLVQEMCRGGEEVILGMHRDERFGPLLMFGMGGAMVELLKDVAFHVAPLTGDEAKEMLLRTRTYQVLNGGPGQEGVDIDAIAEGLQRLSQLVTEFPQIGEMDINPYVVGPGGTAPVAVDAHIHIGQPG